MSEVHHSDGPSSTFTVKHYRFLPLHCSCSKIS